MSFTGNPGTGKTTVALRMANILHRLGYIRKGHLVSVTRDDLVGQYIGHTAPKTREVLKRAMGGVLFIDEAYYLYRPDNERDYGQEAIEILLQVMENNREDLVVILAGYADRMDRFFGAIRASARALRITSIFRTIRDDELLAIAELMLRDMNYKFSATRARRSCATSPCARPSRCSRTPARSATRSTACGFVRPTASSDLDRVLTSMTSCRWRRPTCWRAGCLRKTIREPTAILITLSLFRRSSRRISPGSARRPRPSRPPLCDAGRGL